MGIGIVDRSFWAIAVAVTFVNAATLAWRARGSSSDGGTIAPGYRNLIIGFLIGSSLPWVVMGVGIELGGVPSVWHFFRPQDGNVWVLAWLTSIVVLWAMAGVWIFAQGGAEFVVDHADVFSYEMPSATWVKLFWAAGLGGMILGLAIMLTADFPLPPLR